VIARLLLSPIPASILVAELLIVLAQVATELSPNIFSLIEQLPLVALVVWIMVRHEQRDDKTRKQWLDFLAAEREEQRKVYQKLSEKIENLTSQLSLNTTTVSEAAKLDDVVEMLIRLLQEQNGGSK
jgi:hypothetical protein